MSETTNETKPGRIGPYVTTKRFYNTDKIITDAEVKLLNQFPGVQYTNHDKYYLNVVGTQYIDWAAFELYMAGVLIVAFEDHTTLVVAASDMSSAALDSGAEAELIRTREPNER